MTKNKINKDTTLTKNRRKRERTIRISIHQRRRPLEGLDGGPRSGPDAEPGAAEATGWTHPGHQMPDWVRALRIRRPGAARVDLDAARAPAHRAAGWLDYRIFGPGHQPAPTTRAAAADRSPATARQRCACGSTNGPCRPEWTRRALIGRRGLRRPS
uniref:lipoprotein insertase outer membrane protein LolB n=1 Tax=Massilia oculi TaxID=945844 RepID=UPI0036D3F8C0